MKLDPAAELFITQAQQQRAQANTMPTPCLSADRGRQAQVQAKPERVTKRRPHETGRKPRQMNVTFPSEAWPEALRQMAEHWGLRPADLVTWCVSLAITAIMTKEVEPPSGTGRKQHHVACEWMDDLPWQPKEENTQ